MSDEQSEPVGEITIEPTGARVSVEHHAETSTFNATRSPTTSTDFYVFRRSFVHWILGGFVITVVVLGLAFWKSFSDTQQVAKEAQATAVGLSNDLTKLRSQLADAQKQLSATASEDADLLSCRKLLDNLVSEKLSDAIKQQSTLVVTIAGRGDTSHDIALLDQANTALTDAQTIRHNFEENGAQLPCPIS